MNEDEKQEQATASFVIPDEYKDRNWAKQMNSLDDVFKKIDNQEKYISKGQLPHKDSSAEDLTAFTEKMKKYTAEVDYADLVGNDAELAKALRDSGVPKFQAKAVVDLIKSREAKDYSEDEFAKILDEKFKGRETDLTEAKNVLKEIGEEKSKALLGKRNDVVADVMDILAEVGKKYGVKKATTMASLSENSLGNNPDKGLDWSDPKVRKAYLDELNAWENNAHATEEDKRKIMRKYGRID